MLGQLDAPSLAPFISLDDTSVYVGSLDGVLYSVAKADGKVTKISNPGYTPFDVAAPNVYWIGSDANILQTRLDGEGAAVALGSFAGGAGPGNKLDSKPVVTARGLFVPVYIGGFEAPPGNCGGEVLSVGAGGITTAVTNVIINQSVFPGSRGLYFTNGLDILLLD